MELGDELLKDYIQRGFVYHAKPNQIEGIEHGKFFVVFGEDGENIYGYFFINSTVNTSIINKPEQDKLQIPLNQKDYHFLHHSSYLCCSHLKKLTKSDFLSKIRSQAIEVKGELTPADLNRALERIRGSKIYSNKEKSTFFK